MEVKSLQELESLVIDAINNNDVYSIETNNNDDKFLIILYNKNNFEIEDFYIYKSIVIGEEDLWKKLARLSDSVSYALDNKYLMANNASSDGSDRGGLKYL